MKTAFVRLFRSLFAIRSVFWRPAMAAEPIVFGLVDEVTGPQAEAGLLTGAGREARHRGNQRGGRGSSGGRSSCASRDNASTNPTTVLAYTKLTEAGVVAVIGPLRSTQVQAASPTIAKAKVPGHDRRQ